MGQDKKNGGKKSKKKGSFLGRVLITAFAKCQAKVDYLAEQINELTFLTGEIIFIEGIDGTGWAYGTNVKNYQEGWFPLDKVDFISEKGKEEIKLVTDSFSSTESTRKKSLSFSYESQQEAPKRMLPVPPANQAYTRDRSNTATNAERPTTSLNENMIVSVFLMDGTSKKIQISRKNTILEIIGKIAQKCNLIQIEFFSLSVVLGSTERYLKPQKTVSEEGITERHQLLLKVRFFKTPSNLTDPMAVHLYQSQVKKEILSGKWICPTSKILKLAALQMKMDYGAFDRHKHTEGFFDGETLQIFLPKWIIDQNYISFLERRLLQLYSKIQDSDKISLQKNFIQLASFYCSNYGTTYFDVSEAVSRREMLLGVSEDGVWFSFKDANEGEFYEFERIGKWSHSRSELSILILNPPKEVKFQTVSGELICSLINDYYLLLKKQQGTSYSLLQAPTVDCLLPDIRNFRIPTKRILNISPSRLDLFFDIYQKETNHLSIPVSLSILSQVLDAFEIQPGDSVLKSLRAKKLNEPQLDVLIKAWKTAMEYKPRSQRFTENMQIEELILNDSELTENSIHAIGSLLDMIPIKILKLNRCNLTPEAVSIFSSYLKKNTKLEQLNVGNNPLTNRGFNIILDAIWDKNNYRVLNFDRIDIDEKSSSVLGEMLVRNPFLVSLSLAGNRLGDTGVITIMEALSKCPNLSDLCLNDTNLTDNGIESVTKNPVLKSLGIQKASLDRSIPSLLSKLNGLNTLDMGYCSIPKKKFKELLSGMARPSQIQYLNFCGLNLEKKSGELLAFFLEKNPHLKTLALESCNLSKSVLVRLFHIFRSSKNLKELILSQNENLQSLDIAKELEVFLSHNSSIEILNISGVQYTSQWLQFLITGLQKNHTMKSLNLNGMKIEKKTLLDIGKMLHTCKLENLSLKKCNVSPKDMQLFLEILDQFYPSNLKNLQFDKNNLERGQFESKLKAFPNFQIKF